MKGFLTTKPNRDFRMSRACVCMRVNDDVGCGTPLSAPGLWHLGRVVVSNESTGHITPTVATAPSDLWSLRVTCLWTAMVPSRLTSEWSKLSMSTYCCIESTLRFSPRGPGQRAWSGYVCEFQNLTLWQEHVKTTLRYTGSRGHGGISSWLGSPSFPSCLSTDCCYLQIECPLSICLLGQIGCSVFF